MKLPKNKKFVWSLSLFTLMVFSVLISSALLFAISPVSAAALYKQSALGYSTNTVTSKAVSFSASVTAGNLVVVAVSAYSSATASVASVIDSKGNTYTKAVQYPATPSGNHSLSVWYTANALGGASFSVTAKAPTGNNEYLSVAIHEYQGLAATAVVEATCSNSGTGTSASTSTCTTTRSDDLLFSAFLHQAAGTVTATAGAGYTKRQSMTNGSYEPVVTEDKNTSNPGNYAGILTWGSSVTWYGVQVAFVT